MQDRDRALLESTVALALLRVLRGVAAHPEDEDVLLDEFGAVGKGTVIPRAMRQLLGARMADNGREAKAQVKALDALLVDMVREHVKRRGQEGRKRRDEDAAAPSTNGSNPRLELAARRYAEQTGRPGAHNRVRPGRAA